jgi:hypothetical protein
VNGINVYYLENNDECSFTKLKAVCQEKNENGCIPSVTGGKNINQGSLSGLILVREMDV